MPQTNTFDVTSGVDLQEVDNAVNQTNKELGQRFDFRNVSFEVVLDRQQTIVKLAAPDEMKLNAIWEVLYAKMVKRGVAVKNLERGDIDPAAGMSVRQVVTIKQGIPGDKAKEIVKFLKDQKLKKVQASIQGDQVRVASPSRDELQNVIQLLKTKDFGIALQFGNFRTQ